MDNCISLWTVGYSNSSRGFSPRALVAIARPLGITFGELSRAAAARGPFSAGVLVKD